MAGAKRPPKIEEKAYIEIDLQALRETGEIRHIGAPIIAPQITTKVPRGKFEIVYTADLFELVEKLGNQKMQVLKYLLDHKDAYNQVNETNSSLAAKIGCSRPTVIDTLKIMSDAGLIQRKNSVIMISPHLMIKGNSVREAYLMRKYEEMEPTTPKPKLTTPKDNQIPGQMTTDDIGLTDPDDSPENDVNPWFVLPDEVTV